MYMDEIQYTYKPCELVLMKFIHEINICILDISKLKNHIHGKPKHIEVSFYKPYSPDMCKKNPTHI